MKYTAKPILLLLSPFKPNNQEGKKIKKEEEHWKVEGAFAKSFPQSTLVLLYNYVVVQYTPLKIRPHRKGEEVQYNPTSVFS